MSGMCMCDVVMLCVKSMWMYEVCALGDIVGGNVHMCVFMATCLKYEWEPGLPTEGKSAIQTYAFTGLLANPLGLVSIWANLEHIQKEQLDVGRSLVAMSHVKQKELGIWPG